jgi:hypothetical protein
MHSCVRKEILQHGLINFLNLEDLKRHVNFDTQFITLWEAFLKGLFDFCFFENNMLAHNGVVLAEFHLFSRIARVLFGDVIEPGISGADQFNKYGAWLCHGRDPTNK